MRTRTLFAHVPAALLAATFLLAAGCQSAAPTSSTTAATPTVAGARLDAASTSPVSSSTWG